MPAADFFARFGLYVDPGFAPPDLCRRIVSCARETDGNPAAIHRTGESRILDERVRRSRTVRLPETERAAMKERMSALLPELQVHFGTTLSKFEEPQVLRYREGDFFTPHRDNSDDPNAAESARRRQISVTVCLNSSSETPTDETYSGGSLVFFGLMNDPRAADRGFPLQGKAGLLVAFRSEIVHEVKPVLGGERYSLVTWFH